MMSNTNVDKCRYTQPGFIDQDVQCLHIDKILPQLQHLHPWILNWNRLGAQSIQQEGYREETNSSGRGGGRDRRMTIIPAAVVMTIQRVPECLTLHLVHTTTENPSFSDSALILVSMKDVKWLKWLY
jgi:hypothetical protein